MSDFLFSLFEIKNNINIVINEPRIDEKKRGIRGKKTIEIAEKRVVPLAIPKV